MPGDMERFYGLRVNVRVMMGSLSIVASVDLCWRFRYRGIERFFRGGGAAIVATNYH